MGLEETLSRQSGEYRDSSARLSDEDTEDGLALLGGQSTGKSRASSRTSKYRRRLLAWTMCTVLVIFVLASLTHISLKVNKIETGITRGVDLGHCGKSNTIEEARSLGCVFDPMVSCSATKMTMFSEVYST